MTQGLKSKLYATTAMLAFVALTSSAWAETGNIQLFPPSNQAAGSGLLYIPATGGASLYAVPSDDPNTVAAINNNTTALYAINSTLEALSAKLPGSTSSPTPTPTPAPLPIPSPPSIPATQQDTNLVCSSTNVNAQAVLNLYFSELGRCADQAGLLYWSTPGNGVIQSGGGGELTSNATAVFDNGSREHADFVHYGQNSPDLVARCGEDLQNTYGVSWTLQPLTNICIHS